MSARSSLMLRMALSKGQGESEENKTPSKNVEILSANSFWSERKKSNWFCNRPISPSYNETNTVKNEEKKVIILENIIIPKILTYKKKDDPQAGSKNIEEKVNTFSSYRSAENLVSHCGPSKSNSDASSSVLEFSLPDFDIHAAAPEEENNLERETEPIIKNQLERYTKRDFDMKDEYPEFDNHSDIDDEKDTDFDIGEYGEVSSSDSYSSEMELDNELINLNKEVGNDALAKPLPEKIKEQQGKNHRQKLLFCKFCEEDITSRNFVRHIKRNHNHEQEVKEILDFPVKSKQKKEALARLRNDANFDLYIKGIIRPKKQRTEANSVNYYPCVYCKTIYTRQYLFRHAKTCPAKKTLNSAKFKINPVTQSQTEIACALDPTNVISTLEVKEQVFNNMKSDEISFVAKKDLLLAHYADSYLKSQKRERKEYTCSYKIRELARLLIAYRNNEKDHTIQFKDILQPDKFDKVVSATRTFTRYDPINKTFEAPSVAMHVGTGLKIVSDELIHLILKKSKGFQCKSPEESLMWRRDIKNFKKLVEARWRTEISSVANKDLHEKRWQKPLLVPMINDVKIFREETLNYAKDCEKQFLENKDSEETYKLLVQCTLSLVILFNRRRIGDVQYLKVRDYLAERKTDFRDFEAALSESEKILTQHYRRVVNGGKGSRPVVILIPAMLQNYISLLLKYRNKYIPSDNDYVFAIPKSKLKWAQGDVAIRNLTKKMKLENKEAISSNKLRKHIATAMQVLSMTKSDSKQFSKFMGHTEKTHDDFYELPVDIYQTARVVKLLLMMEKGVPTEFKGKTLSEIELNIDEYVEDDNKSKREREGEVENGLELGGPNRPDSVDISEVARKSANKIPREQRKLETDKRKGWKPDELKPIDKHFGRCITHGTYPTGNEVIQFIELTNIGRSVPVIKSKIQHLIKLNDRKKHM